MVMRKGSSGAGEDGCSLIRARAVALNEWTVRRRQSACAAIAVFTVFTALLLGLLNLCQALGHRFGALAEFGQHVRVATWEGPAGLPLLLGVFMLVLAYQLWMRKRAALVLMCVFMVAQAVADVLRGMSRAEGAIIIVLGMLFMSARSEFPARPNPASYRHLKLAVPLLAVVFFGYGVAGLYLMRSSIEPGSTSVYALAYRSVQVAVGEGGLIFQGWAQAYRDSLMVLAVVFSAVVITMLFRPYREPEAHGEDMRARARELVGRYGSDSIAYFNLRSDKKLFFYSSDMFIAYKLVGDVAVMSGDPVGPVEQVGEAMEAFKEFCRERGWKAGAMVASGDLMPHYEDAGFKGFSLGEEAIMDLGRFTLEGREVRKLRQSVNKLEKMGITVEFMFNASIPAHMRHDLARISADWRGGKAETGFSMGLGRLLSAEDPDCLLSIAYDPEMKPLGFVYWVPMCPHLGYSLDMHRTRLDAPSALSEYIIARTAGFLRESGYRRLSLHFIAFAEHYREDRAQPGSPFWRLVANTIDHVFPVVSVYRFDKKFLPAWKKRLMLHQGLANFLLVGLAVISAESALKLTRSKDRKK